MSSASILRFGRIVLGMLAALMLAAPDANAYIDPGTGSIILQSLIAAIVGGLFFLRSWWGRIKAFFTRSVGRQDKEDKP